MDVSNLDVSKLYGSNLATVTWQQKLGSSNLPSSKLTNSKLLNSKLLSSNLGSSTQLSSRQETRILRLRAVSSKIS